MFGLDLIADYVAAFVGFWRQARTVLPSTPSPEIAAALAGQTVLMTGASGTVIAEAARQMLGTGRSSGGGVRRLILAVPDMPATGEDGYEAALLARGLVLAAATTRRTQTTTATGAPFSRRLPC